MSLFSRHKKNNDTVNKETAAAGRFSRSVLDIRHDIDRSSWWQVYSACLGKVAAMQDACSVHVVKDQDWYLDLKNGTISFGKDSYPIQFIGSESQLSDTWQWGYKNVNGLDERFLSLAYDMYEKGSEWGLEPLTIEQFPLDDVFNGHNIATVACGISEKPYCYYRASGKDHSIFVAFSGVPEIVSEPLGISEFANTAADCLENFNVDHNIFLESFLSWNGTSYDYDGKDLIAHFSSDLEFSFEKADEFWRVAGIRSL